MAARPWRPRLEPDRAYRCPNKKADGRSTPTWCRGEGSAATAPRRPPSPSNAQSTTSRDLGNNPFEIRRINKVRETDRIESIWKDARTSSSAATASINVSISSRRRSKRPGIAQARRRRLARGDRRRTGDAGIGPPTEHRSGAEMRLLADGTYHLAVGSTEMGNGSTTSHCQIAAAVLNTRADRIAIINGDTDRTPYDTGTFASTGTVVAGQAVEKTAAALRDVLVDFASRHVGCDGRLPAAGRRDHLRQPEDSAGRAACGRRQGGRSLRGAAQGLSVAAHRSASTCRASASPCIASPARS